MAEATPTDAAALLSALEACASSRIRDELAPRYGIVADRAFGVSMGDLKRLAKPVGRDHAVAQALWASGWYEARLLASLIDDPAAVTPEQMDRWCEDFDNWGVCDTVCFQLFDRTPHALSRIDAWAPREPEFVRRGAFALLASLALHDRRIADAEFLARLPLIERAAEDDRNFVMKGVSWALRAVGERSQALNAAALHLADRLAQASRPAPRWVGKDALRQLATPAVRKRLASRG